MAMKERAAPAISGDYQYRAGTAGLAPQRFWHYTKRLAIDRYLPAAAGDMIVDAGCGSGVISDHLGQSGARVLGIDPHPAAIAFATSRFARDNVHFANTTVEHVACDTPVDKIYSLEVLEHPSSEEGSVMLRHFHRLLRPGGSVFLTTPNARSVWPLIEWAADRSGLVAPMGGAQHVEMYHQRKLRALVEHHDFQVRGIHSMCLLSPWIAAVSWRAARWTFDREVTLPPGWGPVLIAVFCRR
jgi:2-polyprenyl-3-methyl-5-hydroxy-6-metoxy-1,4-benzoquinol methylase